MNDPVGKRARNVVLLVILTVALPSFILTILGAAAVRNEEAAAKKRVERLYGPVLKEVAGAFNDGLDTLVAESRPALEELLAYGADASADLDAVFELAQRHPSAVNFFVIDGEGAVVVPQSPVGPAVDGACAPAAAPCFSYFEGAADSPRAQCTPEARREAIRALTSEACHRGAPAEAVDRLGQLLSAEPDAAGEAAQLDRARAFARDLWDPRSRLSPEWLRLSAGAVVQTLSRQPIESTRSLRALFATIAHRGPLFQLQTTLAHPRSDEPAVVGMGGKAWRRVVVSLRRGEYTAGFELVPTVLETELANVVAARNLDQALTAYLGPTAMPDWWFQLLYPEVVPFIKDKDDSKEAAWALLTKTDLNWILSLMLRDDSLLPNLAHSRSSLYLWALVLMALALLVGIIYTVRSVIAEARLSRLKTDFVSSVSHDLRTPLTSIRMFSEMLHQKQVRSEAESEEFLGIIVEETERLSRLVERILDFSRMEAGRKAYSPAPTAVAPLIAHALRATKPMVEGADFEVNVEVSPDLPEACVDRDAMIEVLVNLICNAVKYSTDVRQIHILADAVPAGVRVRVRDRGIGISESEQRKIFEKFYRVNNARASEVSGSGIGLSLVEHIVTAHGGLVEVESTPGEGSTFAVTLPAAPARGAAADRVEVAVGAGELTWRGSSS